MRRLFYAIIFFVLGVVLFIAGFALAWQSEYHQVQYGWELSYPYQIPGYVVVGLGALSCFVGFLYYYKWYRRKVVDAIAEGVGKGFSNLPPPPPPPSNLAGVPPPPPLHQGTVQCEYFSDGECKSLAINKKGQIIGRESCLNDQKSSCCYQCSLEDNCETGCKYLEEKEHLS